MELHSHSGFYLALIERLDGAYLVHSALFASWRKGVISFGADEDPGKAVPQLVMSLQGRAKLKYSVGYRQPASDTVGACSATPLLKYDCCGKAKSVQSIKDRRSQGCPTAIGPPLTNLSMSRLPICLQIFASWKLLWCLSVWEAMNQTTSSESRLENRGLCDAAEPRIIP